VRAKGDMWLHFIVRPNASGTARVFSLVALSLMRPGCLCPMLSSAQRMSVVVAKAAWQHWTWKFRRIRTTSMGRTYLGVSEALAAVARGGRLALAPRTKTSQAYAIAQIAGMAGGRPLVSRLYTRSEMGHRRELFPDPLVRIPSTRRRIVGIISSNRIASGD